VKAHCRVEHEFHRASVLADSTSGQSGLGRDFRPKQEAFGTIAFVCKAVHVEAPEQVTFRLIAGATGLQDDSNIGIASANLSDEFSAGYKRQ